MYSMFVVGTTEGWPWLMEYSVPEAERNASVSSMVIPSRTDHDLCFSSRDVVLPPNSPPFSPRNFLFWYLLARRPFGTLYLCSSPATEIFSCLASKSFCQSSSPTHPSMLLILSLATVHQRKSSMASDEKCFGPVASLQRKMTERV